MSDDASHAEEGGNPPNLEVDDYGIRDGAKFTMLAVETGTIPDDGETLIEVSATCKVALRPIAALPDYWKRWLGTLLAMSVERSQLVIITTEEARAPGLVDAQTKELDRSAHALLLGILLHGAPPSEGAVVMSGERREGKVDIRKVERLNRFCRVEGYIAPAVTPQVLPVAHQIATVLQTRLRSGDLRLTRLRRGLHSWKKGIYEPFADERLHEFVRALDALMLLPQGGSRRDFVWKGQILIGRYPDAERVLGELYDLRSGTEHLNDPDQTLAPYPAEGRWLIGLLRSCQAQLLASETYRRILLSEELLAHFEDEAAIRRLWDLEETDLRRLWGDPISLDVIAANRFLDPETGDLPDERLFTRTDARL